MNKISLGLLFFSSTLLFVGCGGGNSTSSSTSNTSSAITASSIVGKVYYNTDTYLIKQDPNSYRKYVFGDTTFEEIQIGRGAFSDTGSYEISGDKLIIDGDACTISGDVVSFVATCPNNITLHFWDTLEKARNNPDTIRQ